MNSQLRAKDFSGIQNFYFFKILFILYDIEWQHFSMKLDVQRRDKRG